MLRIEYRVRTVLADDKAQDEGIISSPANLADAVDGCLRNDYGLLFPVGTQVIIERVK